MERVLVEEDDEEPDPVDHGSRNNENGDRSQVGELDSTGRQEGSNGNSMDRTADAVNSSRGGISEEGNGAEDSDSGDNIPTSQTVN